VMACDDVALGKIVARGEAKVVHTKCKFEVEVHPCTENYALPGNTKVHVWR
jgi:hypothetical protein